MNCKYQDHPFPPCRFEQHPQNPNIYFCPHCRESYDVRDVAPSPNWMLFIIAAIVLILISVNSPSSQAPNEDSTPNSTSTYMK
ncbi:hypothetical protein SD81_018645 [Tolypothrix campylonemoides VB511288]|nr:hypothetical protein SD81_018645 [Tolypothrix campylonemoides VB511288]